MGRKYRRMPRGTSAIDRILANVEKPDGDDGCWLWLGKRDKDGYGNIKELKSLGSAWLRVHRVTYEHFVGPISRGLHIDHLCRVTGCCNPQHLEAVTNAENIRRGRSSFDWTGRCRAGLHEIASAADVVWIRDREGRYRTCRACRNARRREYAKRRYREDHEYRERLLAKRRSLASQPPNKLKTHCPHGHEYSPENTVVRVVKKTGGKARFCRACNRIRSRERRRSHI